MSTKTNKVLRYVLIIFMMFTPVSGALAMQSPHCDMSSMSSMDADSEHQMQMSPSEKSSCCGTDSCTSNCDMGMTVSIFIQTSSYSPVFLAVTKSAALSTDILIRSLTPPSRPPANFS